MGPHQAEPPPPLAAADGPGAQDVGFGEALRVWLRVAGLSFGGPAGQIAVMHRILVEEKRWVSEGRFLHALSFCMLLPGPEAQQLATYIGWLMHRAPGGLMAGGLFILPGVVAIMALSIVYALFGAIGFVAALFFGLKAAVLAIVLQALARLAARALRGPIPRAVAALAFVAIFFFSAPFPLVVIGAGLIGFLSVRAGSSAFAPAPDCETRVEPPAPARPSTARWLGAGAICLALWLAPVAALAAFAGAGSVFTAIALFFSEMAVVTFGGAYAVLAYVAQQAVEHYHWLKPGEMLDGLGMAETTPGPLIMVLQFVGFMAAFRAPGALPPLLAGVFGGLLATWVTFAPCFLWIFAGAPFFERLRGKRALTGALSAITAAIVGVILNLAIWFAIHTIFHEVRRIRSNGFAFDAPAWASVDVWALLLTLAALAAIFRFRLSMAATLAGAAAAGVALYAAGLLARR